MLRADGVDSLVIKELVGHDTLGATDTELAKILTGLHGEHLDGWTNYVDTDELPALHSEIHFSTVR